MLPFRPIENRGTLPFSLKEFGRSVLGAPLLFSPCEKECELLVIAGIHGEEPETVFLISRVLRFLKNRWRAWLLFCAQIQMVAFWALAAMQTAWT